MSRSLLPLAVLVCLPLTALADDAKPDPVERTLAVQKAMATAEQYLTANQPAEAVAVLETQVSNADGNPGFLPLLRRAYTADLRRREADPKADPTRLAEVRRRLNLLGGPKTDDAPSVAPVAPALTLPDVTPTAAPPVDGNDLLRDARTLFKDKKYAEASAKFAAAVRAQVSINQDEVAAWAYCRIKLAADTINNPTCDATAAAAAEKDVSEALQLVPNNAEFQKVAQSVLTLARLKSNGRRDPIASAPAVPGDWGTIETASFRVRFKGSRDVAEAVAKAAEAKRIEIFERWSGAPAGPWQPRCEIVLHPDSQCYAQMTKRPAGETGFATVRLSDGRVTERRIELRSDDATVTANALPRELTHVVLADLFPDSPPPKWAEEGMAVLAGSPEEVSRAR